MIFRDNADQRGWCGACYRLETYQEHADCACVCHGREGRELAQRIRTRSWSAIFAGEIARSARVSQKSFGG